MYNVFQAVENQVRDSHTVYKAPGDHESLNSDIIPINSDQEPSETDRLLD